MQIVGRTDQERKGRTYLQIVGWTDMQFVGIRQTSSVGRPDRQAIYDQNRTGQTSVINSFLFLAGFVHKISIVKLIL